MNIFTYLLSKKKNKETALVKTDDKALTTKSSLTNKNKKTKIRNFVDFVRESLIDNGGNYEDIVAKLKAISDFIPMAKECGVDCNLDKINEAIQDFFEEQKDIKFYPVKNRPYTAFYTKKDGWSFYNYRGITIANDTNSNTPALYFGRRYEKAETHAKDTLLYFGNQVVAFQNQYQANYDEIPLWGDGTQAEFTFNSDNKITKIVFTKMTHPRLKMWGQPQTCIFDEETSKYKLLPTKKIELHKAPVITDSSRKRFTETLLK